MVSAVATVTFWLKIRQLGAPGRYRRAPPPRGTRRRRLYAGYVVPPAQRTRKNGSVDSRFLSQDVHNLSNFARLL